MTSDGAMPELSEEDMLGVLSQLSEMKTKQPEVFKQFLSSLGMGEDTDLLSNGEEGIRKMTESIMKMRGEAKDSLDSGISLSKDGKKLPKGITITPTAGFALKTVLASESKSDKSTKVFINLTQHSDIAKPGMKKKLNDEGEEVEGMNIPMSVGPMHWETDNKDVPCQAYDIIVNEDVVQETLTDVTGKYRDFICQLAIQCVEQKHKIVLDKRYKLPKLKYCGKTIQSQYVQDRKNMHSIEEVSSTSTSNSNSSSSGGKKSASNNKGAKPVAPRVVEIADTDLIYKVYWIEKKSDSAGDASITLDSLISEYSHTPIANHSVNEYVDPIQVPPSPSTAGLLVTIQLTSEQAMRLQSTSSSSGSSGGSDFSQAVQISPYRVSLKLPYYKKSQLYLPHTIAPTLAQAFLAHPADGYVTKMDLHIVLPLDRSEFGASVDAGSKSWLMSQALSDGDGSSSGSAGGENPYLARVREEAVGKGSTAGDGPKKGDENALPEDRFHISLPDDVDKYTGIKMPQGNQKELIEAMDGKVMMKQPWQDNEEVEVFPEDRFHQKDASSTYLINQREQAKKDKWEKYEKEKAERQNDPNVEYVDMDDFRPGGKYADDKSKEGKHLAALAAARAATEAPVVLSAEQLTLKKAAEVVASNQSLPLEGGLTSTLWSELL